MRRRTAGYRDAQEIGSGELPVNRRTWLEAPRQAFGTFLDMEAPERV
jgi:hypothetical protein